MAIVNTLEIADEPSRDGVFTREQAERLARISARTAGETLATKADLQQATESLRARIDSSTALLRNEFEAKLQAMAKELIKWFAGILLAHGIAVIGVTVALMKLL